MQDVPKIVQARLQRLKPGAAEAHPDADLLTAFAEQSLSESERKPLMEHLAHCGDCREVVALALPVTEAVPVAGSTRAVRGAWVSWPVLRWGVVAAGILLVTSVGILQYKQRTRQDAAVVTIPMAKEEKINPASQNTQASVHSPEEEAIIPQPPRIAEQPPKRSRAQSAAAANQPSASPNAMLSSPQRLYGAGVGSGIGGGVFVNSGSGAAPAAKSYQTQQSDPFALAPRPMEAAHTTTPQTPSAQNRPAAAAQQVEVSGAAPMVEVQAESVSTARQDQVQDKQQLAQNQTELPPQKQQLNSLDVVKAKDSVPPQAESSVVFAPMVSSSKVALQKGMLASPRWAISSTGALQRSFDAGQTWEEVNVPEVALAGLFKKDSASAYQDNLQDKKLQRKWKKESNAGLVFRALAAMGAEVWVGGSGSMLYYSLDSGVHWTRVLPTEASVLLTGDIVGVELSDAEHASVSTSTGEIWITPDHGQTWHKQQ